MIDAHLDEIGFVVNNIGKDGLISLKYIGGGDSSILSARNLQILTEKGIINAVVNRKHAHLVEDEEDIRDAVVLSFETQGCHVVSAPDGQEAIEQLSQLPIPPDVVVSDFKLGANETGVDVILAVRSALGETVPGVLLSGDTNPASLQELYDSGITVLHKPVRTAELRKAIEDLGVAL